MVTKTFVSVWVAISDAPEQSASMKVRALLLRTLTEGIKHKGLSQEEAANALGITQPRLSELMRGKIQLFSIDKLIAIMAATGMGIGHIGISASERFSKCTGMTEFKSPELTLHAKR